MSRNFVVIGSSAGGSRRGDLREERPARCGPAARHAEELGQRGRDVGEGVALAQVDRRAARVSDQQRDALAGVVRAAEGRVVAVVGGDDQQVLVAAGGEKPGQPAVELDQGVRVPRRVAPVPVNRIEID
jgi:hypothetical protein